MSIFSSIFSIHCNNYTNLSAFLQFRNNVPDSWVSAGTVHYRSELELPNYNYTVAEGVWYTRGQSSVTLVMAVSILTLKLTDI